MTDNDLNHVHPTARFVRWVVGRGSPRLQGWFDTGSGCASDSPSGKPGEWREVDPSAYGVGTLPPAPRVLNP